MREMLVAGATAWMVALVPLDASAQTPPAHHHEAASGSAWHVMQDSVAFLTFNHQGGPRGGRDFGSQNWWMGMAERPVGTGTIRFNLMLSLDPATVGNDGYREIFQVGETFDWRPLIDRQHPHDFLMQAALVWRVPLAGDFALTLAGAPVGEPALGPVAFMHRSSALENPSAPLSHHTFDSTHIAMGVLTAALDRGPWQVETSVFRGQEPDEERWDLMDPGALDSWSVRGWYRPSETWTFQLSHGFLTDPEVLDPGNVRRTSVSATWLRRHSRGWTASTAAYGRRNHPGEDFNALLAETTHVFDRNTIYARFETLQVESDVLRFGVHGFLNSGKAHVPEGTGGVSPLAAITVGGLRTFARPFGWDVGGGGDVTFYGVPEILKPTHGDRPVSFHVFMRVRPPVAMGRMVDMIMTRH